MNGRPVSAVSRVATWVAPPLLGLLALLLGQDASWDLRNYHFYDPHAWLHGRLDLDVAVAHVATFYNPTLHLPFYWAVTHLQPRAVGFLLGALAGLNVPFLLAICRRVDQRAGEMPRPWVVLALTTAGLAGAMFVSELGTSFGDNLLSVPVLAAVALVLRDRARLSAAQGWRAALLPALLCGAAAGLKLPFAVYGVALAAMLLWAAGGVRHRLQVLLATGGAGLAGALLTGGWWAAQMWQRYGNPVFPYFNEWFGSPWASAASYRDPRFLPEGPLQAAMFPLQFALAPRRVAEVAFFDLRFPLLYLAALTLAGLLAWRALRRRGTVEGTGDEANSAALLLVFVGVAFLAWMRMFGIARYLVVGELLAPAAIWAAWRLGWPQWRPASGVAMLLLAALLLTLRPADWSRRPWSRDYFDVAAPTIEEPSRTLVLMVGNEPGGYLVPYLPASLRFLRIDGYFTGPSPQPNESDRAMQRAVRGHRGPVLFLFRSYERPRAVRAAAAYGLRISTTDCRAWLPGIEPDQRHPFELCGEDLPAS